MKDSAFLDLTSPMTAYEWFKVVFLFPWLVIKMVVIMLCLVIVWGWVRVRPASPRLLSTYELPCFASEIVHITACSCSHCASDPIYLTPRVLDSIFASCINIPNCTLLKSEADACGFSVAACVSDPHDRSAHQQAAAEVALPPGPPLAQVLDGPLPPRRTRPLAALRWLEALQAGEEGEVRVAPAARPFRQNQAPWCTCNVFLS